ncbi:dolichol kinase [Coemansia sp. RSA 986]|nr:dolichol kinase [Coemansia sp. RSA 986]
MIININPRSNGNNGDSKHKRGRGTRLYYEACIPTTLFIVTTLYHTIALKPQSSYTPNKELGGFEWAGILSCVLCVGMALVPLFLRLGWQPTGGIWGLVSKDDCTANLMPRQTSATMYRRSADDGIVWGVVLVPLVVMATELAYSSSEPPVVDAPSVLGRADTRMASIAMALRLALSVLDSRTSGKGEFIGGMHSSLFVVWMAAVFVLGCTASAGSSHHGFSIVASAWKSAVLFGAAETQQSMLAYTVTTFPRSFTLGEASVVTQGVGLVAVDLAGKFTQRLIATDLVAHRTQWASHVETLLLETTVLGLVLLARVLASVTKPNENGSLAPANDRKGAAAATAMLAKITRACVAVCFCGVLSLATVAYVSCINPVVWAFSAVAGSSASAIMCIYWIVLLACGMVLYTIANNSSRVAAVPQSKFVLHLKRKAYHILAVLMFVPGYLFARQLQHFAFTVALAAFVVAEAVRALDIPPWGRAIDVFVRKFTDYRDAGAIVTSHFYLLLGCAVPVWLGGPSAVACLAGVMALGLADTAASLVGMATGRVRWPGTAKTIEGTVGFIVCLAAAALAVDSLAQRGRPGSAADGSRGEGGGGHGAGVAGHLVLCTVLGVVEALTEQNDNLVIPLCMYAAVHVCAQMRLVAFAAACLPVASALVVMPRLANIFQAGMRRHVQA